ncbi:CBS domain-containing protein [Acidocella sp.]|uniref:CBS domain-containing protein n=1 Tax=Acidocella sp. TaxID=50710 RepID=UPI00261478CC|nr:CBS domain-containing protein [Acidocella sp.]
MIVADVMSREVTTVVTTTSLAAAARLMVTRHISGVPVLDGTDRLAGILTEGDLLRRPELGTGGRQAGWLKGLATSADLASAYAHTNSRFVGDVMTPNPVFIRPEMSLTKATELMIGRRVKRLPVLRAERLVGMLTRFDLLTALSARLPEHNGEAPDDEIHAAIASALASQPWAPQSGVRYAVQAGCVRLEGQVFSSAEARALRVLAQNTKGVKHVVDALRVNEPARAHTLRAE